MVIRDPQEIAAFDMYFASIRSMQFHPGAGTREHRVLSVAECAAKALEMIHERRKVIPQEKASCRGE